MLRYILKRVVWAIISLFFIVTITFFLMRMIPGGPFTGEKTLPQQILDNLNAKYGLNQPLHIQYIKYVKSLLRLDLGVSMRHPGQTVNEIIARTFPVSAKIGLLSIIFTLLIGIPLGVWSALHQGKWQDNLSMIIATIFITIPSFVLAVLLVYFFGVKLGLLPVMGLDEARSYILPVVSLSAYSLSFIARLIRSSMIESLSQDYIRTAKAKGLSKTKVVYKHALKNSLIPVVTYLGPLIAGVLTGSFVVEKIFLIPGMGQFYVTSISDRDYSLVMGTTIFYAAFLILMNLIVDIIYVFIDPRIKLED
ncbi:ABC transporter permease [Caldicellulosiruptoraceae bacterium PP1]